MVSSDEYVSEGTGRKPFPGSAIVMVIPPRKWPPCPLKLACPGCPAPPRPTWCPCRPDCPALPRSPWCLCRPDCPWPTPVTVIGDNQNSHRNHQIKQDLLMEHCSPTNENEKSEISFFKNKEIKTYLLLLPSQVPGQQTRFSYQFIV